MKTLQDLSHEHGYNSVTQMCLQNKVAPQKLFAMRGAKSRLSVIQSMATVLGIPVKELADSLKFERLLKIHAEYNLTREELEQVFIASAKQT